MRLLLRSLWRVLLSVGWLALIAGVLLHAWWKDQYLVSAFFFYAMPKPCLAALAFTLLVWPRAGRLRRWAAGFATFGITAWWLAVSWGGGPGPAEANGTGPELRVLYWNLCRPGGLDEEMVALVTRLQPDVAAFLEPGPQADKLAPEYQKRLPGYEVTFIPRGILWVTRLPSGLQRRGKLHGMGAFASFEVKHAGVAFPLIAADVYPHPLISRETQLQEVLSLTLDGPNVILAGDFNTPAESLFFGPYRRRFTHAFDAAGSGLRETWPVGLPLLSLDHIWVGPAWSVISTEKHYDLRGSDHAALFVVLKRRGH